jgi:beta-glucanase (GH16 family)
MNCNEKWVEYSTRSNRFKLPEGAFFLFLILLSFPLFSQPRSLEKFGKTYRLFFNDEFSKRKVNIKKWVFRTDSKHWSSQNPENVFIHNGLLHLKLKKDSLLGKAFQGAGLISKDTFGFGYYEAAMQTPKTSGWHSSFWLMVHDGSGGTNPEKTPIEIDIIENDSKVNLGYRTNIHRWKPDHQDFGGHYVPSEKLNQALQKVACLYLPDSVYFFYNDKLVDQRSISTLPKGKLNIWLTCIASHLGGTEAVDLSGLPSELVFDYVRYYSQE